MKLLDLLATLLTFLLELWRARSSPAETRKREEAQAEQEIVREHQEFEQAIASNDGEAVTAQLEQLRDRIRRATAGRGRRP